MLRFTLRGTHKGDLMGIPPTGKQVTTTGVNLFRLAEGKSVEELVEWDALGILHQLGVASTGTAWIARSALQAFSRKGA